MTKVIIEIEENRKSKVVKLRYVVHTDASSTKCETKSANDIADGMFQMTRGLFAKEAK